MSNFVCAISGMEPELAVVSAVSGEVFEKRLIVKYIEENGTDPINAQKLDVSNLVELKQDPGVRSMQKSLATASLPSLLKQLQDEWDATMLNNFTLRQELKAAREELTHALYQNDAACRVINRLSSELQSARQIIATLPHGRRHAESETEATDVEMHSDIVEDSTGVDGLPGISDDLVKFFTDKYQDFSTARKQRGRNLPEALASVEQIQKYEEIACHDALHSASVTGITALDMQKNFIASGGMDKTIVLFDSVTETIKNTYKGHQKRISAVRLHPNLQTIVSGSFDSQIRIWNTDEQNARNVIAIHDRPITDVSLHPTGDFALCCSEDSHWSLTDLKVGRPLIKAESGDDDMQGICCGQFHPDGLIFGTGGKNSVVKIWDIKEQVNVAQFPGHQDVVAAISFSENGYYLATGSADGEVKIWDLRKLKNLKTLSLYDVKQAINCLTFDQSGAYLAVGGSNVQVYQAKTWNNIAQFNTHTQAVTGVCFSEDSKTIVSSSMDKSIRVYAIPAQ
ncbi:hypothetical protein GPALN_006420 [Globodera pallida]|uniref:Pre-mRNA-processing factor 19 n=1 Tax=Globodera pallida TaxID=36090 RepID=A0A183BNM5_GLOPA|nr:hypothetical protein GPALN_006420 [Globodera pallida]